MLKKRLIICAVAAGLLTGNITAFADEPCDYDYFIDNMVRMRYELGAEDKNLDIPEGYSSYSKALLNAASKGVVSFDELDKLTGIVTKQDAFRILYEILTQIDPQYKISDKDAEKILNTCYDNAYLKEENKVAYASMIRHGIVGTRGLTDPDKVLTKDSLEIIKKRVCALFEKKLPITIGTKKICIGSSVNELENNFGLPDRVDKNKYGFEWYVYNSRYSEFIMIGVHDDVVCAYFTNASEFEFDGLTKGITKPYKTAVDGLEIMRDNDGCVDAVLYNPFEVNENAEYDKMSENAELCDIINAQRTDKNLFTYVTPAMPSALGAISERSSVVCEEYLESDNPFKQYEAFLKSDSAIIGYESTNSCTPVFKDGSTVALIDSGKSMLNISKSISEDEEDLSPIKSIKTPELISPVAGQVWGDDALVLSLSKRCANRYFVKIYNLETETYDVYAYIDNKSHKIKIPSYMLTKGNKYRVCVSAVDGDEELVGNTVEFTYGTCSEPVKLLSPAEGLSTYDDELEIAVESSAYHDFRIDVYDEKGKLAISKNMSGIKEVNLESLPAGRYTVGAVAISHATGEELGYSQTVVEIKSFSPIINEFILEPGESFKFYYGDEKDWLYFYDCETIAVTKNTIEVVQSEDIGEQTDEAENTIPIEENGNVEPSETVKPQTETKADKSSETLTESDKATPSPSSEPSESAVPEKTEMITEEPSEKPETTVKTEEKIVPVTVYKKRVIQRKVPATKKYRALAALIPKNTFTSGAFIESHISQPSNQKGSSIAALALSYQGVPYVWGGASPTGFDCSGLVKYVCNSLGIKNVARTSAQQFASSGVYIDRANLQPGDFVYFQNNGTIHHVGIYIGNNMMVHAPHTGDVVKVSNLSDPYYLREYAGAKRVY